MTNKKREKKYVPPQRHNPEMLTRRVDKQQEIVEQWKKK